jgi:hypothetical protein
MNKKKILFVAFIFSIALGCSQNGVFNPTLSKNGFRGITFTDENGEINGLVDPDDWRLYRGKLPYFPTPKSLCSEKSTKSNDDIVIYPGNFEVKPAYPNPTNNAVTIEVNLGSPSDWSYVIINEQFVIIDSLSGHTDAGGLNISYNFRDDKTDNIPDGFYRVIYRLGRYSGHGDIWVK